MAKFQSTHLHEVRPRRTDTENFTPGFQSTHLHEVRRKAEEERQAAEEFQSTHLHEVRRIGRLCFRSWEGFNPRTYMRCDLRGFLVLPMVEVSIHAPT